MNEMTNDELRMAIAKAKYERVEVRGCEFSPDCGDLYEVQAMDERYLENRPTSRRYVLWPCWFDGIGSFTDEEVVYEHWVPVPDWPDNIAAAWELEGEIPPAEVERYVLELTRIINAKEDFSTSQRWQLIHATSRERCLAYLAWKAAK